MFDVTLAGNLAADPDLKHDQKGRAYLNVSLAHAERRKSSTGEWEDAGTSWVRLSVFGRTAENVAGSLRKGDRVLVQGSMKLREFTRDDGSKGTSAEMAVSEIGPSLRWATVTTSRNPREAV